MGDSSRSIFSDALEAIPHVKSSSDHDVLTKPFLDVCRMVIPVLGESSCSRSAMDDHSLALLPSFDLASLVCFMRCFACD
jgi:hypothetical protein